MGGAVHQRRRRAPKTPTLLDVLGVRGKLNLQNHERSLPRGPDSNLRVTASPTRIVGGDIMSKRIIEEGSVEAIARLQKQDEEFCRRLRAASTVLQRRASLLRTQRPVESLSSSNIRNSEGGTMRAV